MKKYILSILLGIIITGIYAQESKVELCPCITALGTPTHSKKTMKDFNNRILLVSSLVKIPCADKNNNSYYSIANQKYRRGIELQFFEYLYQNYRGRIQHMKGHNRVSMPLLIFSPNATHDEIEKKIDTYFGKDYVEKVRTLEFVYDPNLYLSDKENGTKTLAKFNRYKAYFEKGIDY